MYRRTGKRLLLALVLAFVAPVATAQEFAYAWDPRSGDEWVDEHLAGINDYGHRYREAFVDEIVRYHDAPRELVSGLLVERRWAPGDVYFACAMAQVIGRPCRYVADAWARDHGQGWGDVAKGLGVEPDSEAFQRLKRGFVHSYDRWNRPLELDGALRRAFPARGKARPYAWSEPDAKATSGPAKSGGQARPGSARKASGNGKAGRD